MNRIRTIGIAYNAARRGIAAVEFALMLPFFIVLFLGGVDCAIALLVNQRVDRVSYAVTDLITQSSSLTKADLNTILSAAEQLMLPYPFSDRGMIIVSSVYRSNASPYNTKILWQYTGGGTYTCGASGCASHVGATGQVPTMPDDLVLNTNDNVIVVEVFYHYTPLFIKAGVFSEEDLYRAAVYKPRLSALTATPL